MAQPETNQYPTEQTINGPHGVLPVYEGYVPPEFDVEPTETSSDLAERAQGIAARGLKRHRRHMTTADGEEPVVAIVDHATGAAEQIRQFMDASDQARTNLPLERPSDDARALWKR